MTFDGCGRLIVWFVADQKAEGMKIQEGGREGDGVTKVCKAGKRVVEGCVDV